jgi:hypothetical protein
VIVIDFGLGLSVAHMAHGVFGWFRYFNDTLYGDDRLLVVIRNSCCVLS